MYTFDRIIFCIIILLPIVDMTTAYTAHLPISVGAFIRTILMLILLAVTLFYFYQKQARLYFYSYVSTIGLVALNLMTNFFLKSHFLLYEEVNFALKTMYFITILFTVIFLLEKATIRLAIVLNATTIAALIIGVSFWLSILLKINQASYTYDKLGTSGLFFAANEFSVIVLILLACNMMAVIFTPNIYHLLAYFMLASILTMIGTKTALYGGIFFIVLTSFLLPFIIREKKQLTLALVALLFFITIPLSPAMKNQVKQEPTDTVATTDKVSVDVDVLLSSRTMYVASLQDDFVQSHPVRKLFGLGYGGDGREAKMAEMDLHDLFFSYGILGTIGLCLPFLLLAYTLLQQAIGFASFILALTCLLWIGISWTAGHILFAPSVMTYLAIFLLILGNAYQLEMTDDASM